MIRPQRPCPNTTGEAPSASIPPSRGIVVARAGPRVRPAGVRRPRSLQRPLPSCRQRFGGRFNIFWDASTRLPAADALISLVLPRGHSDCLRHHRRVFVAWRHRRQQEHGQARPEHGIAVPGQAYPAIPRLIPQPGHHGHSIRHPGPCTLGLDPVVRRSLSGAVVGGS